MKTWTTSSVSLAEEMVRYMLGDFLTSFRIIKKSVSAPMPGLALIRIVDINGTVLTEEGEGKFSGTAVVCKESGIWLPKWCVLKVHGCQTFGQSSYPLRLNTDGVRLEKVPDDESSGLLEKYHPCRLRPPRRANEIAEAFWPELFK